MGQNWSCHHANKFKKKAKCDSECKQQITIQYANTAHILTTGDFLKLLYKSIELINTQMNINTVLPCG